MFGIINPIIARTVCGKLQVVCGYRRLLAAQVSGVESIPVIITKLNDSEAVALFKEESSRNWINDETLEEIYRNSIHRELTPKKQQKESFNLENDSTESLELSSRIHDESEPDLCISPQPFPSADLIADLGGMDGLCEKVGEIYLKTREIFDEVYRQQSIPQAKVERLLDKTLVLAPIKYGFDVREIGDDCEESADMVDQAVSSLAAHSLRVAFLAQHFTNSLTWSKKNVTNMTLAGLLHDVGMLLIPVNTFQSNFPLTKNH